MIVKDGIEQKLLTPNEFLLESISSKAIHLPYTGALWDDLNLAILSLVWEQHSLRLSDYNKMLKDIAIKISFNIQPHTIRLIAYVNIDTDLCLLHDERVYLMSNDEEIQNILDRFFESGGRGLRPDFLNYLSKKYALWKKRI